VSENKVCPKTWGNYGISILCILIYFIKQFQYSFELFTAFLVLFMQCINMANLPLHQHRSVKQWLSTDNTNRYIIPTLLYLVWMDAWCSRTQERHWTVSLWQWYMGSGAWIGLCSPHPHGWSWFQSQSFHLHCQNHQTLKTFKNYAECFNRIK